jgi:uncharacterized protein
MEKIATILLLLALLIIFSNILNLPQITTEIIPANLTKITTTTTLVSAVPHHGAALKVPAVDEEGNGVVTTLIVEAQPGQGRVLTDVNNLLFWVDTQYSIRTAQRVAQAITKVNISRVDLIYAIETNASLIEGPSAGAALTIATIAALENKSLNQSVMITGTINPDGSIGAVGAVAEKAKASKDVGATLFLVPEGQGTEISYKPIQKCEKVGPILYCTTKYKTEKIDISESVGITVKEVSTVDEALKYFLM